MRKVVGIGKMHCSHCADSVKEALSGLKGVKSVKVHLKKQMAVMRCEDNCADEQEIRKAVTDAGFEVLSITDKKSLF